MSKIKNGLKALSSANNFIHDYIKSHDDSDLNWGCFMLQQSMELMLKGIVECYGEESAFGHLISDNSEILQNLYNKVPELKEIDNTLNECNNKAYIFISWKTKTRYSVFNATDKNINIAFKICNELKDYIYKHKLV